MKNETQPDTTESAKQFPSCVNLFSAFSFAIALDIQDSRYKSS
ncbi:hypothetical protein [Nostoc sp.]